MEKAVEDRLLPEGSTSEQWSTLQAAVLKKQDAMVTPPTIITQTAYNAMVGLLLASAYCFAPQGRIGGFGSMHRDEYPRLQSEGYALTRVFKTSSKYGVQPVVGSNPLIRACQVKHAPPLY